MALSIYEELADQGEENCVIKPYSNTICDSIMNVVNVTRDETVAVIYIVLTTK